MITSSAVYEMILCRRNVVYTQHLTSMLRKSSEEVQAMDVVAVVDTTRWATERFVT